MFATRKQNGSSWYGRSHPANTQTERSLQARLKSIRGNIGALQDDVAGLVNDVGDVANYQVTGIVRSARDTADRVETWGTENLSGVRKMVQDEPFKACAIAAGAGALLSLLFFRR
jgi:ElaB/YqjD/DUF883 family membrane-anchored ribosome-binding protein